jgi:UDP-N-acetylglucosamine--N-acetylmuramyl-(pentapeptide) pyrophosphoryl-undecaprenol N-acetylglucosamine transferase
LIFATVGTHHQPFDRFVRIAIALAGDAQLVVQHGHTGRVAAGPSVQWHRWLAPRDMTALMRAADVVVTHAGVASIVDAVRAGHRPIVVPRRQHLGEHVDDHQLQIVAVLEERGIVTRLHNAADAVPGPVDVSVAGWPPPGLKAALRATVLGG